MNLFVRAELLTPLVAEAVEQHGTRGAATMSGISERQIYAVVNEKQKLISVSNADKMITYLLDDPGLWHRIEGLDEFYTNLGRKVEAEERLARAA